LVDPFWPRVFNDRRSSFAPISRNFVIKSGSLSALSRRDYTVSFCCPTFRRGIIVDWGTIPQVRRSRVQFPMKSLDFLLGLIRAAALWLWSRLSF
jgi:hypothetical protein